MRASSVFAVVVIFAALSAVGCGLPSHGSQTPFQSVQWQTYTSPDGRVSFEHPANFKLNIVPRKSADDPQLALSLVSPDGSTDITLILRVSDEVRSDYCAYMHDMTLRHPNTRSITERERISRGAAEGLRQEFREGSGWTAREFIALALEAQPVHVHFTCGYTPRNTQNLRPICQRIADSLTLHP
jgi:hypothetical protein